VLLVKRCRIGRRSAVHHPRIDEIGAAVLGRGKEFLLNTSESQSAAHIISSKFDAAGRGFQYFLHAYTDSPFPWAVAWKPAVSPWPSLSALLDAPQPGILPLGVQYCLTPFYAMFVCVV
jgi:hypothetical protein